MTPDLVSPQEDAAEMVLRGPIAYAWILAPIVGGVGAFGRFALGWDWMAAPELVGGLATVGFAIGIPVYARRRAARSHSASVGTRATRT